MLTKRSLATLVGILVLLGVSHSQAPAATSITSCGTHGAGSYILANNISSAGINCLIFNAGPVTLDLGGYTVTGSNGFNGILATNIASVTVRNGTLNGFGRGIYATGSDSVVDGVRALTGSSNGITIGDNGTIEHCIIRAHGGGGILAGKNATIIGNTLNGNTGNQIVVSDGSTVRDNTLTGNGGANATGIQVSQNCLVEDNIVVGNTFGIAGSGQNDTFRGNTVTGCKEGLQAGASSVISGNNISNNSDHGLQAGANSLISNNMFNGNQGIGATDGGGTLYLNNVANGNKNISGINPNSGDLVSGNVVSNNQNEGMEVFCPVNVIGNTAIGNVLTNIDLLGSGCSNINNLAP